MLAAVRHLTEQRRMLSSLGQVALGSLLARRRTAEAQSSEITRRVPGASRTLIEDFLRHVGAAPFLYADELPPPLFPQWVLPVALQALAGSGYPVIKMLNGGCRVERRAALRQGELLDVRAQLLHTTEDERRIVLHQRLVTDQAGAPDALITDLYGIIRTGVRSGKTRPPLPSTARELERWQLPKRAGLEFALLTGDLNPLHWAWPYARALGFRGTILHGFSAMARSYVALERELSPRRLRVLDVRFVRPLTLPAEVGLFVDGERVFVGRRGEPAYLTGTYE
jgi:hypothetical protein